MPPRIPRQLWARAHPHPLLRPTSLHTLQIRTIKSIMPLPAKFAKYNKRRVPAALSHAKAHKRKEYTTPLRTGLLATKKGMSAVFDPETGTRIPCTVLQIDRCQVVGHKTAKKHGYWAVQIGVGSRKPHRIGPAMLSVFAKQGVPPKRIVMEFKVKNETGLLPVGTVLEPSWFQEGQLVDTRSVTKGKGFAGGMKRHGWSGQPASHGQSLAHRIMGSAGGGQGSGSRVHPGKNMPGRMGNEWNTIHHLPVLKVDNENGLVLVKGCVSGPKDTPVQIYDSKKRPWQVADLKLPLEPSSITPETELKEMAA